MHFWHTFWLSLYIADNHRFPREYYGLMIKYTKSHHPNWCIKVGNTPPRLPCCCVIPSFFCNETWQGQSVMLDLKLLLLKKLYDPFLWMGFNCLKATKDTARRQFTLYYSGPRTSWYSFSQPWKDPPLS